MNSSVGILLMSYVLKWLKHWKNALCGLVKTGITGRRVRIRPEFLTFVLSSLLCRIIIRQEENFFLTLIIQDSKVRFLFGAKKFVFSTTFREIRRTNSSIEQLRRIFHSLFYLTNILSCRATCLKLPVRLSLRFL